MNNPDYLGAAGTSEKVIFKPDCIFCNKEGKKKFKKKGIWATKLTTVFELEDWHTMVETAEIKPDEKLIRCNRGFDLFACKAQYHPSCHICATCPMLQNNGTELSEVKAKSEQGELENSHRATFAKICDVIDSELIQNKNNYETHRMCDM